MLQKILNKIDSLLTRHRVVAYTRTMLVAIIVVFIIGSYMGYINADIFRQGDFVAFYTAGVIVTESHEECKLDLYDFKKQKAIQYKYGIFEADEMPTIFLNPPVYAWLMAPFSKLPYNLVINLWRLISVLIALISVIILTKGLRLDVNWWDILTILLVSMPGLAVVVNGQNTFLFLGFYAIAYLLLYRGKDFPAGAILGLGALKPQLILFLPVVLLFQKRWDALLGFATGALLITAASVTLVGLEGIVEYLKIFTTDVYLHGIQVQANKMHSLPAFIRLILGLDINPAYLAILTYFTLATVFGYLSVKKGCKVEIPGLLTLSILGTLIVNPHLFHYDLSLLLLPFLFIYAWAKNNEQNYIMSRNARLALVALYIYLWLGFIFIDIIRIQLSALLIIYLFVISLKNELSTTAKDDKIN